MAALENTSNSSLLLLDKPQDDGILTSTDNPFAYLERNDFTSEKFKIEIRGLPKFYGIGELKKLLNEKLKLGSNKIKPPRRGSRWVYVCFRSEEDRLGAINALQGYAWKNSTLSAEVAQAAPDPLVQKRKQLETNKQEGIEPKKQKQDEQTQEERIKASTIPCWNIPYEDQLRHKEECIQQTLKKLAHDLVRGNPNLKSWVEKQKLKYDGLPCELWSIRKSPMLEGYRNKCEFTVGIDAMTGKRTVGFRLGSYVRGFTGVAPVECLGHIPERMKQAVLVFEKFVRASELEVYSTETQTGHWRQLTARLSFATNQLMLVVGVNPQQLTPENIHQLKEDLKEYFSSGDGRTCNVTSLYFEYIYKKQSGVDLLPVEHLMGETHIHEKLCGLTFRVSPEAFFQVNTAAAEVLYDAALEISKPTLDTTLVDICCGTGSIGLSLAKHCGQVLGLELLKPAVDDAKANALHNGINNCDFFSGRAEEILSSVLTRVNKKEILAIVDPPRAGLHRNAVVMLRRAPTLNKLLFMSCDPRAALQNFVDLARPTSKAYRGIPLVPVRAVPVDMFPHTKHCELIVYFERFNEKETAPVSEHDRNPSSLPPTDDK